MDTIILTSDILTVLKIHKKTSAKMFKNLEVGDRIVCSVPLQHAGSNRGQTYATYITAKNMETGEITKGSFNQITTILRLFELEDASSGECDV